MLKYFTFLNTMNSQSDIFHEWREQKNVIRSTLSLLIWKNRTCSDAILLFFKYMNSHSDIISEWREQKNVIRST